MNSQRRIGMLTNRSIDGTTAIPALAYPEVNETAALHSTLDSSGR